MAKRLNTKRILMVLNVVALVGLSTSTGLLFMKNKDLKDQVGLTAEEQNKQLIAEVNKVYDLPEEDPVVAKVTNVDEFKKQFDAFKDDDIRVDDYLLFYRKNRLNVIYRKSEKKVVKTAAVAVPITVEIVGSDAAIAEAEKKATASFGNQISVVKTKKDGITQSFVFDVDNDQTTEAKSISEKLAYEVGTTLPTGFTPGAQTEIVVVVAGNGTATTTPADTTATQQP